MSECINEESFKKLVCGEIQCFTVLAKSWREIGMCNVAEDNVILIKCALDATEAHMQYLRSCLHLHYSDEHRFRALWRDISKKSRDIYSMVIEAEAVQIKINNNVIDDVTSQMNKLNLINGLRHSTEESKTSEQFHALQSLNGFSMSSEQLHTLQLGSASQSKTLTSPEQLPNFQSPSQLDIQEQVFQSSGQSFMPSPLMNPMQACQSSTESHTRPEIFHEFHSSSESQMDTGELNISHHSQYHAF